MNAYPQTVGTIHPKQKYDQIRPQEYWYFPVRNLRLCSIIRRWISTYHNYLICIKYFSTQYLPARIPLC